MKKSSWGKKKEGKNLTSCCQFFKKNKNWNFTLVQNKGNFSKDGDTTLISS
jgi:hypothetical protein